MSHGNGSSAFFFQVMGILKPVTVSTDKGLQLSHSPMVGCHSLFGSKFDFRMTYFDGEHGKMLQSIVKEVCSPILHKEQGKMLHSLVESIFSPSFYKSMQNCCYILGPMAGQKGLWLCQAPFLIYKHLISKYINLYWETPNP